MSPLLRWLLAPASLLYAGAMTLRNRRYDRIVSPARRAAVPVISVGNVTVGGTGKTPMVIEIVRLLRAAGRCPAIVTRGYRGSDTRPADEVLEYRVTLPETPVIVNADRVEGAAQAVVVFGVDCVVLDDGFQHRRIERDLDLVLIDALDPWGGGWVLPAGRLREPLAGLARAHLFVITRANQAAESELERIERRLYQLAPGATVFRAAVQPQGLVFVGDSREPLDTLAYHNVLPVCGVGNPASFLKLVQQHAGRVCAPRVYRDHHAYSAADAARLREHARLVGADLLLTTRKDWVKLAPLWPVGTEPPLARLETRVRLLADIEDFEARIRRAVEKRP